MCTRTEEETIRNGAVDTFATEKTLEQDFVVNRPDGSQAPLDQNMFRASKRKARKSGSKPYLTQLLDGGIRRVCLETDLYLTFLLERDEPKTVNVYFKDHYQKAVFGTDACRSLTIPNAGGKSEISEAHSIHMFAACFQATNFLCENEVSYWAEECFGTNSKMVDFVCSIMGQRVGVSVTRAMMWPTRQPERYTKEMAERLVQKKVYGLIVSREAVTERHSFNKSILHVWCQTSHIADLVTGAFEEYKHQLADNTGTLILLATVCSDREIYTNHRVMRKKIRLPRHLQKKLKKKKS